MKIAIITLSNRNSDYVKYTNITKQKFSDLNKNINFIFINDIILKDKHPVWSKIPAILQIIDNYDYVIWIDDDALICNFNFDCEKYFDDYDIYYTNDNFGLNFGVFAIKNSEIGKKFLNEILNHYEEFKNNDLKEQDCAKFLLSTDNFKSYAKELPANIWNAYLKIYNYYTPNNLVQNDTFIIHLPGTPEIIRNHIIKDLLNKMGLLK